MENSTVMTQDLGSISYTHVYLFSQRFTTMSTHDAYIFLSDQNVSGLRIYIIYYLIIWPTNGASTLALKV